MRKGGALHKTKPFVPQNGKIWPDSEDRNNLADDWL